MARKNTKKRMRQPQAIELDKDVLSQALTFGATDSDALNDDFFSDPPPAPAPEHSWDEPEERPKIARDKRRAMIATITIFSVFALAVGGFTIYTKLIMPTPVTLGASSATFTLPQAPLVESTPAPTLPPAPVLPAMNAPAIEAAPPVAIEPAAQVVHGEPNDTVAQNTQAESAPTTVASDAATVRKPTSAPRTRSVSDNNDRRATTADASDSLAAQAMRALNSGDARQARQLAQQATHDNPERADGWIVLGAAHDALGDHTAALTAYATCTARAFGPRVTTCRALAR